MMRAEFQVLVIPFLTDDDGNAKYAVFKRRDNNNWQVMRKPCLFYSMKETKPPCGN
jgi:hypothetical protein